MLFGKISPQVVIPQMITPFEKIEIVVEYITAIASPYRLGDNEVVFNIFYGNFELNNQNQPIGFSVKLTNNCTLSGQSIENWGTDDSEILNAIATQQGTTITEFVQNDIVAGV